MVKYNYLANNESNFPHIGNVDVFKYDNEFDYGRFDAPQMELQICTVPWDMGEAHIGNRTISGIGNVVYFESKNERDSWFDAIPDSECYRFTTKFKELHRSLEIDVPIPYDMCAKHNYLVVRYAKFANEGSPIEYEDADGLREWFWFIREVEFLAPSTTRLHLLDDAFQTWIYDVNVSGMLLERGHAPMFATSVDDYLSNPINNNGYLLTEDVNYGEAGITRHMECQIFNEDEMLACIATTANPKAEWGSKSNSNWHVPAQPYYTMDSCPSVFVFAMAASDLNTFLTNITGTHPQFKQTVQGVFFASEKLVTKSTEFTFGGVECFTLVAGQQTLEFLKLDKSMFGYGKRYAEIAKLYTSPYAHIEITDENGNVDMIRVEDTSGKIDIRAAMSLAYPFITIDAHLLGVGGHVQNNIGFYNITKKAFRYGGKWFDTLRTWQVPTFAVVLDPAAEYDYSSYFDRAQSVVDYTAAYDNATASAATAKTNADASADTGKANEDANADTAVANTALQTAANTAVTTESNAQAAVSAVATGLYNSTMAGNANSCIAANATSTIQANEQQATIGAAAGAVSSTVSAIGAAASGNVAGAVTGVINGLVGAGATLASMQVGNALTAAQAANAQALNSANASTGNTDTHAHSTLQQNASSNITSTNNTYLTGATANSAATQKANASRTQTTQKSNAANTQATENANALRTENAAASAITNGINQAALRAPFMYGEFANGESAATKPMGLFAHVVTQSKGAIETAGDEFLRYGYMFDRQWDFDGNWNVGKYFTYWKLRDFWVSNLNVPDMYMDKLRFFLFGGVTVWRKPEYIGHVSVYDNFN